MSDTPSTQSASIAERLHAIRAHLQTGALGQREAWEDWLTEAADEIVRLRKDKIAWQDVAAQYTTDNERLRAENAMLAEMPQEALNLMTAELRADIERLREALHETTVAIVHVQKHLIHGSPPQDAVMNGALAIARRALEPKP